MAEISTGDEESNIIKGILGCMAAIPMVLPVWQFTVRVRRYRHPVPTLGLVGSILWLIFATFWVLGWLTGPLRGTYVTTNCEDGRLMSVVTRILFAVGQTLLYSHFIMKAQLLNRNGKWLTKLQILSIAFAAPVPVVGIVMLLTMETLETSAGSCLYIANDVVVLIQGILHLINSILPTISFVEQTCNLILALPSLQDSFTASNTVVTKARLIFTILTNPAAFQKPRQTKSVAFLSISNSLEMTPSGPTGTASQDSERSSRMTIIRLVRRVLLATIYSCLATVIIYTLDVSGIFNFETQVLYIFDLTVSWIFAVYASPLPQETGKAGAFASWQVPSTLGAKEVRWGASRHEESVLTPDVRTFGEGPEK